MLSSHDAFCTGAPKGVQHSELYFSRMQPRCSVGSRGRGQTSIVSPGNTALGGVTAATSKVPPSMFNRAENKAERAACAVRIEAAASNLQRRGYLCP